MNYKQNLKLARVIKGKIQADIASILGMQTAQYQRYESGLRQLSIEDYKTLADYYNCTIDQLCGRNPYIENQEAAEGKDEE